MTDDLDFVGKMSHDERLLENFRLDCISPNDGKYREDSDTLRPYISARADWMGCTQVLYVMLKKGVEFDRGTEKNVRGRSKVGKHAFCTGMVPSFAPEILWQV